MRASLGPGSTFGTDRIESQLGRGGLTGAIGVRAESRAEPMEVAFDDYLVTRAP